MTERELTASCTSQNDRYKMIAACYGITKRAASGRLDGFAFQDRN
jgi:hypothetical protein